ncbi:MAG: phytoene/squalene synthase family protein [Gemmatimonadaceae bacterium]
MRTHARTFTLASHFLPPAKRRAAFALYAFCRVADDIVDDSDPADPVGTAHRLAAYGLELERALAGRPDGPVFRELARFVAAYEVPPTVLRELLAGIARDIVPASYRTWAELGSYCEGVASTVGEMCTHIFGVPGGAARRDRALGFAHTLGVAMQLTNILRDVGEDARRGRCYLPEEELLAVGLSRTAVLDAGVAANGALARDGRWRTLLCFQVARARALYAAATPGISLLAPDAQRCATACASGYAAILGAIEARGYDTLSGRARVSAAARARILWGAWRLGQGGTAVHQDAAEPVPSWAHTGPSPIALHALHALHGTAG